MYTNMLFIELPYPMQHEVQFLPKSWRNIIVCYVDQPCICIVFILYYCTVNMHEEDVCMVHYFVSSKNNENNHFWRQ